MSSDDQKLTPVTMDEIEKWLSGLDPTLWTEWITVSAVRDDLDNGRLLKRMCDFFDEYEYADF